MSKSKSRTAAKPFSTVLDQSENELFTNKFNQNRNEALAIGVVQLLRTFEPLHDRWTMTDTGVVAFVKDYSKRSFYFRLIRFSDINQIAWEQELYDEMKMPDKAGGGISMIAFEADVGFAFVFHSDFTFFKLGLFCWSSLC